MTGKRNLAMAQASVPASRTARQQTDSMVRQNPRRYVRIVAILAFMPLAVFALFTLIVNILWHDLRNATVDWGVCIG
jgi:hypothetical protein